MASNLHKENLAKKKREREEESAGTTASASAAAPKKSVEKEYVDRAQQRRKMYGSDTTTATAAAAMGIMIPPNSSTVQPPPPATIVVRPEDILGSSNVGHQMLQKLGWKSGTTLGGSSGRGAEGEKNQILLTKDWQRIENLAAGRGKDGRK